MFSSSKVKFANQKVLQKEVLHFGPLNQNLFLSNIYCGN